MVGLSCLYLSIFSTTVGVATLGLLPPMVPGRTEPVSRNLPRRQIKYYEQWIIKTEMESKGLVTQAPITRTKTRTIQMHALDWSKCSTQNTPTPFNQSSACIFIVLVVVLFVGACVTGPLVHPSYFSKYLKYRGKARRGCNMLR